MNRYFLHDGQQQSGPFNLAELKSKGIRPDTSVWADGMAGWARADQVDELRTLFASEPPPFIPAAAPVPPAFVANNTYKEQPVPQQWGNRRSWMWAIGTMLIVLIGYVVYNSFQESALIQAITSEVRDEKKEMRQDWKRYLTAIHSEYQYREIGGIFNLKVVFANNSKYMMNEMTASITYVKANGSIWRIVPIKVYNVAPYTTITQPVEDVSRGTSVKVELTGAVSREANFNMMNGYDSGEPGDPYHMR